MCFNWLQKVAQIAQVFICWALRVRSFKFKSILVTMTTPVQQSHIIRSTERWLNWVASAFRSHFLTIPGVCVYLVALCLSLTLTWNVWCDNNEAKHSLTENKMDHKNKWYEPPEITKSICCFLFLDRLK